MNSYLEDKKNNIIHNNRTKTKVWYNKEGEYHREDGPAYEYANGDKYWYINGRLHRDNGPAIEYFDRGRFWYKNGLLHREDGPAVELVNGDKEYWINGVQYDSLEEGLMDFALELIL